VKVYFAVARPLLGLLLATLLGGCGEDDIIPAPPDSGARRGGVVAPKTEEASDIPPALDFQETAFVESERSRDPFRSFARVFLEEERGAVSSQREVVLEQYAIEQLRLVALVGGIEPARAMLIDPAGVGHVVKRGQYVGRASVVQPTGGSGASYEVNWRVDRIRDGDMVLVRDDPTNPEIPSATRVIPLRTDEVQASGTSQEKAGGGLESELRKMQERLAQMAAVEAARKRQDTAGQATDEATNKP